MVSIILLFDHGRSFGANLSTFLLIVIDNNHSYFGEPRSHFILYLFRQILVYE